MGSAAAACAADVSPVAIDYGHDGAKSTADARRKAACSGLAQSAWPRDRAERQALLQKLESVREQCMDHPAFLATLGGNWLEEGNLAQALLWLERALLLDPDQLGAQADHALALAASGEPAALDGLLVEWKDRRDIPPTLLSRLVEAGSARPGAPTASPQGGGLRSGRWAQSREVSLLFGYESNLDRSPRLSELTLTRPDGPVTLPVDQKPQPGGAATTELSWQAANSPAPGTIVQAGLQGSARSSPGHPETDWHLVQFAAGASQRWKTWRAELQASAISVGGRLNEPYRLVRWGLSLESNGFGCTHRVSADAERRRQSVTASFDSRTTGALYSALCPLTAPQGWTGSLALRLSTDRPEADRTGGVQRQWSVGARVFGPVAGGGRMEIALRTARAIDSEGYSPDLKDGARRWLRPMQLSVEYAHPTPKLGLPGADWLIQMQAIRQEDNLEVFRYTSISVFSGLRWRW